MFHTCRLFTLSSPVGAKIAQIRWKRQIIERHPVHGLQNMFGYNDPEFSGRISMLLLASHLAGMAACAVIIFNQQSIFRHLTFPPLF